MRILQSASFRRAVRGFGVREKKALDTAVRALLENPALGEEKKGALRGIFVYKFKAGAMQYLLAYRVSEDALELIMIGPHENYYRDLSHYLRNK